MNLKLQSRCKTFIKLKTDTSLKSNIKNKVRLPNALVHINPKGEFLIQHMYTQIHSLKD